MRQVRIWAAMLLALVMLAACGDAPTAPQDAAINAGSAGPSSDYVLDPVIVIGEPKCDPWMDANWCKGSQTCMTSTPGQPSDPELITVNSCPGSGGGGGSGPGGGGGGGTGGTGGTGGSTGDPSKQTHDDTESACPPCDDAEPTPAQDETMESLLPEVQCSDARSTLTQMLGDGSLRVYTQGNSLYGVWNSDTQQIYINWTKHLDATGAVDLAELADTMVHEAVHKLLGHVNGQPSSETHGEEFRNKMAGCGFPQP